VGAGDDCRGGTYTQMTDHMADHASNSTICQIICMVYGVVLCTRMSSLDKHRLWTWMLCMG
jgi:hypothetical protein